VEIRVKQAQRSVFLWAVLVAVAILVVQLITAETQPSSEIPFSTFRKAVEMGAVSDVVIHDNGKIEGKIKPEKAEALGTKKMTAFETMGRVTDDLQDLMSAKATEFRFKRDEPSMWGPILSAVLPMLFVFAMEFEGAGPRRAGNHAPHEGRTGTTERGASERFAEQCRGQRRWAGGECRAGKLPNAYRWLHHLVEACGKKLMQQPALL
jgi:ATP-dependent Zn protease